LSLEQGAVLLKAAPTQNPIRRGGFD